MAQQAGSLIDEWSANIIGWTFDAKKFESQLVQRLQKRGIPNFSSSYGNIMAVGGSVLAGGKRDCLWLQQKLRDGGMASVAFRIERISKHDTALSWALFAQNKVQAAKFAIAKGAAAYGTIALIGAGLLTVATGGALAWLLPGAAAAAGLSNWHGRSKGKPTATDSELREALSFGRIVEDVLMKMLASHHVPSHAVQVLVSGHSFSGMPNLANTNARQRATRNQSALKKVVKRAKAKKK